MVESVRALPSRIPVFPLAGALLLPSSNLPLNIFEPRYLTMVRDAMRSERMIGMVQPREPLQSGATALYDVGCIGKITAFQETDDGRFLITLSGICRFTVREELRVDTPYRQVEVDYGAYAHDLEEDKAPPVKREPLMMALKSYLDSRGLSAEWDAIDKAPDYALVNALATICPFEPAEKQALLEAPTLAARCDSMIALMQIAAAESYDEDGENEEEPVRH